MSLSSFISCIPKISPQVKSSWNAMLHSSPVGTVMQSVFAFERMNTELFGRHKHGLQWSFMSGARVLQTEVARTTSKRKRCSLSASWFTSSQVASHAFTLGTVAVLPFYTLMLLVPNAEMCAKLQTRRAMESSIPYVVLGILYTYLLYLSWSPETFRLMFASKYWLPELPGIAKMFSSQITVASAWIHLLAVDLFAARQVFHDGLKNNVETRHSVSLCLLFCPIGIAAHAITKLVTRRGSW